MNIYIRFTVIAVLLLGFRCAAQTYTVTGRIADKKDTSMLSGVTVTCAGISDTNIKTGTVTDSLGVFTIGNLAPGRYKLHFDYVGYKSSDNRIRIDDKNVNVGTVAMSTDNELKAFTAYGKQVRAEQSGDTTSFHADAFKVNPDATTEDLINKMPGVSSDNTGVKVHGEAVQQVYVDGKPFFGTDPTLSVRNLPAEVVDQVQVYDQLSDQALFTGFDDGNSQKTMNIITKKDKRQGEFGKAFAGYGTDGKFNVGGAYNSFEGDRRISIIESSNNINVQNFSSQDILGVSGGGAGGGRGGAFGGGAGGGGAASSFLTTAQQPGLTTVHSAGINYSDQWGPKVKVTASYFFNYTDNVTTTQTSRSYTFPRINDVLDSAQTSIYNEHDSNTTKNFNHRFNFRLEYTIDSSNSIVITPNVSLQNNYATTWQIDSSFNFRNVLANSSFNTSTVNNTGYTFSGNFVYRHKFPKKGRTISLNVSPSLNEKTGDGTYNTLTAITDSSGYMPPPVALHQVYNSYTNGNSVSTNLAYTEPLGKMSQLLFNYNPSVTKSKANTETDTFNTAGPLLFDTVLSNKYQSTYTTQRGGISYRLGHNGLNLMIGANLQYAVLDGTQTFPSPLSITKYYTNVLPIAMLNYKFKDGRNLRIFYRTNISPPGIGQLQNVVNVSNPSILTTGNEKLRQDYEQTLLLRYGLTKKQKGHNFFVYGYANYVTDYITNATFTTTRTDSVIANGILLNRNAQLLVPENMNYYSSDKLYMTYGLPFDIIKSNLNLTGGLAYTHTPGEVNNVADFSNDFVPTGGVVISSNVSPELDFTLAYSGSYNFVKNSLQGMANNNYYNHTASFKINWIFLKGFVINSNISNAYYSTLSSSSGNINYYLWTSYVGYKFLKKRALEVRLTAFDMLNQNKSVTRTVAANYVENDITNVIQRYYMLQLTYTLRNYKGPLPEDGNRDGGMHMHDWGGGGWQGGGGGGPH